MAAFEYRQALEIRDCLQRHEVRGRADPETRVVAVREEQDDLLASHGVDTG